MNIQEYLGDKSQTWRLFDRQVSSKYDLVADLISLRLYRRWCGALARALPEQDKLEVLDLATGTGAIPEAIIEARSARGDQITGVDLSEDMLAIFRQKIDQRPSLGAQVTLLKGDATALELPAERFDAVTMACGIRNVSDANAGMREIYRVLKPGGKVFFLEPAIPKNTILKGIFLGYFRYLVPLIAGLFSNGDAYRYFNRSVEDFPYGEDFLSLMREAGFQQLRWERVTLGAGALYIGERPERS